VWVMIAIGLGLLSLVIISDVILLGRQLATAATDNVVGVDGLRPAIRQSLVEVEVEAQAQAGDRGRGRGNADRRTHREEEFGGDGGGGGGGGGGQPIEIEIAPEQQQQQVESGRKTRAAGKETGNGGVRTGEKEENEENEEEDEEVYDGEIGKRKPIKISGPASPPAVGPPPAAASAAVAITADVDAPLASVGATEKPGGLVARAGVGIPRVFVNRVTEPPVLRKSHSLSLSLSPTWRWKDGF